MTGGSRLNSINIFGTTCDQKIKSTEEEINRKFCICWNPIIAQPMAKIKEMDEISLDRTEVQTEY